MDIISTFCKWSSYGCRRMFVVSENKGLHRLRSKDEHCRLGAETLVKGISSAEQANKELKAHLWEHESRCKFKKEESYG